MIIFPNVIVFIDILGNAAGKQSPPLIIFKGARLPNDVHSFLPKGYVVDKSDTGWMNCDTFFSYISTKFYPWLLENNIIPPVIVFVDGHISHRSLKLCEFCSEKQIILVSFLPNATQYVQPMDVTVFRPTKLKWSNILQNFKHANPNEHLMKKPTFCELLKQCLDECLQPNWIKKGFSATGLYPFGANNFDFSKLPSSKTIPVNDDCDIDVSAYPNHDQEFIEKLENFIELNFPNRVIEFKSTIDEWQGDEKANDLFVVWKSAIEAVFNQQSLQETQFDVHNNFNSGVDNETYVDENVNFDENNFNHNR